MSNSPAPVELAPGVRTTLFIPVRALTGYGDGDIQATISGLALPGETVADQHKQWKICLLYTSYAAPKGGIRAYLLL